MMNNVNKLKIRGIDLSAIICFAGIFIFNSTLVCSFYSSDILKRWSIPFFVGLFLLYICTTREKKNISFKRWETPIFYFIIIFEAFFLSYQIFNQSLFYTLSFSVSNVLFMFIISYRIRNDRNLLSVLKIWMWFLRMCAYIIVVMCIIDLLFDYSFTGFVANLSGIPSLLRMYTRNRVVSYMGHPLFTAEILIAYYLFSNLYNEILNRSNNIFPFLLAIVGIVMTQSRIGIVLIVGSYLLLNFKGRRYGYIIVMFVILAIIFMAGGFDGVISRFTNSGFIINDNRIQSLISLLSTNGLHFYWFRGQDTSILSIQGEMSAALEYVPLRLAYVYGIFFAIVISIISFIYPLVIVLIRKQRTLIITLGVLILDVNSYSGFADIGMRAIFYYVMVVLILNISNYMEVKEKLSGDLIL